MERKRKRKKTEWSKVISIGLIGISRDGDTSRRSNYTGERGGI